MAEERDPLDELTMADLFDEDPFGGAVAVIRDALEAGLEGTGSMNNREFVILCKLATIVTMEAGMPVNSKGG